MAILRVFVRFLVNSVKKATKRQMPCKKSMASVWKYLKRSKMNSPFIFTLFPCQLSGQVSNRTFSLHLFLTRNIVSRFGYFLIYIRCLKKFFIGNIFVNNKNSLLTGCPVKRIFFNRYLFLLCFSIKIGLSQ